MPPAMANNAITPPATPPAIAPTLVELLSESEDPVSAGAAVAVGVTTSVRVMTRPLSVTTVGIVTGSSADVGVSSDSDDWVVDGFALVLGASCVDEGASAEDVGCEPPMVPET